jgi:hypothetical protein
MTAQFYEPQRAKHWAKTINQTELLQRTFLPVVFLRRIGLKARVLA